MPNVIEVENLTKVYGLGQRRTKPVFAVDHINFAVHQGEVFGIFNPGRGQIRSEVMHHHP